jgi:hypothetical protein
MTLDAALDRELHLLFDIGRPSSTKNGSWSRPGEICWRALIRELIDLRDG